MDTFFCYGTVMSEEIVDYFETSCLPKHIEILDLGDNCSFVIGRDYKTLKDNETGSAFKKYTEENVYKFLRMQPEFMNEFNENLKLKFEQFSNW